MKLKYIIKILVIALAIIFLVEPAKSNTNWFSDITFDCDDASTVVFNAIPTGNAEINCPGGSYFGRWSDDTTYLIISLVSSSGGSGLYPESFNSTYLGDTSNYFNFEIGANATWDKNEYLKGQTGKITVTFNATNFDENNYNYFFVVKSPSGDEYINDIYSPSYTTSYTFQESGVFNSSIKIYNVITGLLVYESDTIYHIITADTTVSFIAFNKATYTLGQTGTISWGISASFWNNFNYNYIEIYKDGSLYDEIYYIDNFGTKDYKFPEKGKYTLKLYQSKIIGQDNLLSTSLDSWVMNNPSYININETVGVGQVSNFTYKWGETPTQTGFKWAYIKYLDYDTGLWVTENTVSLSGTVKDTIYYSSSLIKKEGDYLIELCDLNFPCPMASQTFNSIYLPNTPIRGYQISILNITSSKSIYSQGDLLQFDFQIDSSNFTNNTVTVEIYNNESKENYTLLTAQEDYEKHNYYLGQLYGNGPSQLRLIGTNSTNFRNVLSSRALTVSIIDNEGYGLEIDKTHPCNDEEITVTAISPVTSTITFSDRLSKTYNFTGTRTWRIIPDGDMTISLENNYGLQKKSGMINVNDSCNQVNIETPSVGEAYGLGEDKSDTAVINNLLILIGMPIFWGLVFISYVIYYLKNSPNLILPALFIVINIEAVVGLLEPYTTYIVIVTWLIIAMNFIFIQKKATG